MAKAYSLDLRERVYGAWQRREGSQREVAVRFGVSERFVRGLARRQRESGGVAAKPHGGGQRSWAAPAVLEHLTGLVAANNDHTIAEHHAALVAAGFALSAATAGRLLLRLRQTRKKRRLKMTRPAANG